MARLIAEIAAESRGLTLDEVGGVIDGQVNPTLTVYEGELVQVNLINGEGAEHDVFIDGYNVRSSRVIGKNASSTFSCSTSEK